MDGKSEAGLGEEFAAAGRGGGEDEHREIIAGSFVSVASQQVSRLASQQVSESANRRGGGGL
jgi:hypothetical protein